MEKPLFIYFDGRGRGECVRILLAATGTEFEERNVKTRDEFLAYCKDGTLLFGQIPYLKWGDVQLVQSGAILRYVAKRTGVMGSSITEAAKIDMLYEGTRALFAIFVAIGFGKDGPTVAEDAKKTCLPKYMPVYDKVLKENNTGYLVGNSITLADTGLLEVMLFVEEYVGSEAFEHYPNIQRFMKTMKGLTTIDTYLKEIRKPPSSVEYVETVNKVLGRA